MQNIFTLEPVVHLKDLLFAVVDGALSEALDVSQGAEGDTQQNLSSCLDLLQTVEGDPLDELAEPLTPYRCQLEFAFLTLVRQAFVQHCLTGKLSQDKIDVQLVDDDLDKMTGELVCDILRQVCRNGVVQDQRYFGYQPIHKCVLVDHACRQALHELVTRHVRFVPFNQPSQPAALDQMLMPPSAPPSRDLIDKALDTTPSDIFPHHSASNVCTPRTPHDADNDAHNDDVLCVNDPHTRLPSPSGSMRSNRSNHSHRSHRSHQSRRTVRSTQTPQLREALVRKICND